MGKKSGSRTRRVGKQMLNDWRQNEEVMAAKIMAKTTRGVTFCLSKGKRASH